MDMHDTGFDVTPTPTDQMADNSDDYSTAADAGSLGGHDIYGDEISGDEQQSGLIEINVGGHHSEAEETIDLNQDGVLDSAAVPAGDGNYVVFTDTDADGVADRVEVFDPSGQQELAAGSIDAQGNVIPDGQGGASGTTTGGGATTGGGYDPAAANPHPGWVEVRANGGDLTMQENADLDQNGAPDSVVMLDQQTGDYIAYTDANADGLADHVEVFDASGNELGEGQIDVNGNINAPGGHVGPYQVGADGTAPSAGGGNPHPGEIDVNINGRHATGQETIDLNHDGTPDSAAVQGDNGDVVVFTDTDADGDADRVEIFDPAGNPLGAGSIDDNGNVIPDNGSGGNGGQNAPAPTYAVDAATGEWSAR